MKKNFFKKLSFVLALAMIIATIAPAAGAFAATALHLNSTKRYLYLGGVNEFDFNISHATRGSKAAWLSSDVDVAEVDETTGYVTGTGLGTATISVDVTAKDGTVTPLEATVVVRDNIDTINSIYCQTDAKQDLAKLEVGKDYDFGRTFTTDAGSTTATSSKTVWTVNSTKATISTLGVFKATEAGDYKITVLAFQSTDKANAWKAAVAVDATSTLNVLDSKTLDVKVINDAAVAQVDATSVKLTFKSPVAALTAADVAVNYIVGATNTLIPQVVKSVTLATDKMSAVVVMYNAFAGAAKYSVAVTGMAAKEFTGAGNNVADVDYFTITPATVPVNDDTAVVVKLFNKEGVDITTDALLSRVVLSNSSEKVLFTGGMLTIFNVGDTTTISGVFHTYNYDNTTGAELGTKTASAVVTGVPVAAAATVGSVAAWTIATTAPANFDTVSHVIAAGDGALGLKLYVRTLKSDATYDASTDFPAETEYRFTSTDSTTLIVNGNTLYPVKAGTANVLVEYSTDAFVHSTVLAAIPVTVTAARVATTLNLGSYVFALSNDADVADTKAVSIEVKDQYGSAMGTVGVNVSENPNTIGGVDPIVAGDQANGTASVTFAGSGRTAGTYTYKITANGLSKYVVVNVQAPSDAAVVSYYKLHVDNTTYDRKVVAAAGAVPATDLKATVQVYAYAANGVANDIEAVSGGAVSVTITRPDGTSGTSLFTYAPGSSTIQIALANGAGAATQLATGTYTLKLYEVATGTLKDTATFTVTDSTPALVVTTVKLAAIAPAATIDAAVQQCFTAKLDGADVVVVAGEVVGRGNVVFVKTVTYTNAAIGVTYTATVNTAITLPFAY